mmetsp:Transcript_8610/g.23143  ORF Transcript_8610/g.23143 Transcript_8610/m.23143 type:complete len:135 (-) Transcript_8610:2081-2485(-)
MEIFGEDESECFSSEFGNFMRPNLSSSSLMMEDEMRHETLLDKALDRAVLEAERNTDAEATLAFQLVDTTQLLMNREGMSRLVMSACSRRLLNLLRSVLERGIVVSEIEVGKHCFSSLLCALAPLWRLVCPAHV